MLNIVYLLPVAFFIQEISCEHDLLSKFHQHRYKMKDFRTELVNYDKNYFNVLEIKSFKFNRTTTAHNLTMNFKVNFADIEMLVQTYKFLSNEYRRIPDRFQVNLKKCFDSNVAGMNAGMKKCGNFTSLDCRKDVTYQMCNFLIDETQFPPLIPNGRYKSEIQYLYMDREIAMLNAFLEIYTPVYPKN